jgi:hypothetical protein
MWQCGMPVWNASTECQCSAGVSAATSAGVSAGLFTGSSTGGSAGSESKDANVSGIT